MEILKFTNQSSLHPEIQPIPQYNLENASKSNNDVDYKFKNSVRNNKCDKNQNGNNGEWPKGTIVIMEEMEERL